ncbi:MAG TPA: glycosyltransferase family 4 protein [Candidatus Acidoferrales bacterium]|nr:glycosyltransferase family 4 protein [Candidatus Acidoferrales bacterium]
MLFGNAKIRAGVEEHILQLLTGFDRDIFDLHLACTHELADLLSPDLPKDVKLAPLDLDRFTDLTGAIKLAGAITRYQIDLLHCHTFRASFFASPLARICRVPVIIETSHGREVWRRGWLKSKFYIDRMASSLVDHFVAVSSATAEFLIQTKRIAPRRISVIRSAIDLRNFDPRREPPPGLRERLGFGPSDRIIVVAGRLEPQKGHAVLLHAMPLIRAKYPQVRLVCLSDGSLRPSLEAKALELGIGESVRFVGRQPDVRDWLALGEISVLPSLFEGLPLAAIEALALCKPVVASHVDGTPEVVLNGRTGLTVPPSDPEKLAEAICKMLQDPESAKQMAMNGRELVKREFSVETLVQRTQDLYLGQYRRKTGEPTVSSKLSVAKDRSLSESERGSGTYRADLRLRHETVSGSDHHMQ